MRIENEQDESFFLFFFFFSFEKYINWNRSIVKYRNIYVYIYIYRRIRNILFPFIEYIHRNAYILLHAFDVLFFPPFFPLHHRPRIFYNYKRKKKKKKRKWLTKRRSRRSRRARRLFLTNSYMPGGQTWEHTKNTWSMRMIGWIMIVDLCTRSQLFTINKSLINILLD